MVVWNPPKNLWQQCIGETRLSSDWAITLYYSLTITCCNTLMWLRIATSEDTLGSAGPAWLDLPYDLYYLMICNTLWFVITYDLDLQYRMICITLWFLLPYDLYYLMVCIFYFLVVFLLNNWIIHLSIMNCGLPTNRKYNYGLVSVLPFDFVSCSMTIAKEGRNTFTLK